MTIHAPLPPHEVDPQPRLAPKLSVDGNDEISALKLAVPIVRRWPAILGSAALFGAVGLALTFVIPPRYTARTTFTVESNSGGLSMPKGLVGLAGQLGVLIGGSGPTAPSPEYFTALANAETIGRQTLTSRFTSDGRLTTSGGRQLLDLLGVKGNSPDRRVENGLRRLDRMLATEVDRKAGIVMLKVSDQEPRRAAAVANRLIELLNRYNVEQRRSRSRQQREFAERRLGEVQGELRAAEERLQNFLSRNRTYRQSPLLVFEVNRLERAVEAKQDVVATLTQAYEEARIAEAGDTPVISVIDAAVPPTRRSFPIWWQLLAGGLLLGGLIGLVLVFLLEARRTWIAEQQPDFLALRDAARAWKARLRGHPVRG